MTANNVSELQSIIDLAWESRTSINAANSPQIFEAVETVIAELNAGRLRVAERQGVGQWTVNQWVKKAVLLSFRLNDNKLMRAGDLGFYDKVPTKFAHLCAPTSSRNEGSIRATQRAYSLVVSTNSAATTHFVPFLASTELGAI